MLSVCESYYLYPPPSPFTFFRTSSYQPLSAEAVYTFGLLRLCIFGPKGAIQIRYYYYYYYYYPMQPKVTKTSVALANHKRVHRPPYAAPQVA